MFQTKRQKLTDAKFQQNDSPFEKSLKNINPTSSKLPTINSKVENPSTINQNKTSIRLNRGLNTIKVETDLNCQGFFEKEYFFSNNITLLSNPVNNILSVQIGGLDEEFNLKIFDIYGKEIRNSSRSLKIDGRIINVNVNDFQSGIYFARFSSKTIKKSIKFIKND